jgi:hypothetical protein
MSSLSTLSKGCFVQCEETIGIVLFANSSQVTMFTCQTSPLRSFKFDIWSENENKNEQVSERDDCLYLIGEKAKDYLDLTMSIGSLQSLVRDKVKLINDVCLHPTSAAKLDKLFIDEFDLLQSQHLNTIGNFYLFNYLGQTRVHCSLGQVFGFRLFAPLSTQENTESKLNFFLGHESSYLPQDCYLHFDKCFTLSENDWQNLPIQRVHASLNSDQAEVLIENVKNIFMRSELVKNKLPSRPRSASYSYATQSEVEHALDWDDDSVHDNENENETSNNFLLDVDDPLSLFYIQPDQETDKIISSSYATRDVVEQTLQCST